MTREAPTGVPRLGFPGRRRTGVLGNYNTAQLTLAGTGAGLAILSMFTAPDPVQGLTMALIPAAVLIAVGLWFDEHGHPLLSTIQQRALFTMRKLLRQTSYRRTAGMPIAEAGKLQLPGALGSLRLLETQGGGAIIEDAASGTATAVVEVTSPGYGLLDDRDQEGRVAAWAQLQSGLVNHVGLARVQVLSISRVAQPKQLRDYYERRVSDSVSSWAREQYETLLEAGVATTTTHRQYLAVVLDKSRIGKEIRAQGGGRAGLVSVMAREVAALRRGLADCSVTVRHWLGSRQLAAVTRIGYDPTTGDLIEERTADRVGVAPESAGPMAGEEQWDHIQVDGVLHRTFEITEWPRIPTLPDFLNAVNTLPFQHAMSLYFSPVKLRQSISRIKRERGAIDSNRELRQKRGNYREDNAFERRERDAIDQREEELTQGFGDLEYIGLISVTATTLEDLDAYSSELRTAVESKGMEVRPMFGQQLAAFNSSGLPFALAPAKTRGVKVW
ncbi:SCO6880 family protein [Agromyces indicus]|uniref:SCO6880 family protein n=1 Tax=Agromyces indicus TaxID=758919 RepID=UPI00286E3F2B|nr:SCO6880 family protein [Agromyces indicus]